MARKFVAVELEVEEGKGVDVAFVQEANRLWRALWGSEIAVYQSAAAMSARIPESPYKTKALQEIAERAREFARYLEEME